MCPFCENDDQSKLELYFSEDRKFERAELCHNCKKYLVSIDTRNMVQQPAAQVAALGMIYLDFLAQEKGFAPGAVCAWNVMETPKR
jgi:FdhE protein